MNMSIWAPMSVLEISMCLFIRFELQGGCFMPSHNSPITFLLEKIFSWLQKYSAVSNALLG